MRGELLVERRHQVGQIALAFGQRQPAGRQRHAGHGIAAQARPWRQQPGFARDALDLGLLLGRHIGDDQILVGRDAEIAVVHLRNLAQAPFAARRPATSCTRPFCTNSVR